MESLNQFVNSLAPKLSHWRRDFHHYAESGWVEFRTATLVAEELHQLGYSLALGRISFCSTVSWIPATLQTRRETGYLLFVSLALSTYLFGGMAADVAGVVSCRSADRSGYLPTFVLRENGC